MPSRTQRPRFIDPFQPEHIRRLVKEFGSPLLIVDAERVRVQFRKLRKALPGVENVSDHQDARVEHDRARQITVKIC